MRQPNLFRLVYIEADREGNHDISSENDFKYDLTEAVELAAKNVMENRIIYACHIDPMWGDKFRVSKSDARRIYQVGAQAWLIENGIEKAGSTATKLPA